MNLVPLEIRGFSRKPLDRRQDGFTLLEVVLALSIALGLLVVVLYYYQQAAHLRDATLRSTAGLAAVRLCLDRLGTELRTASAQPGTFRGGPQEIEFRLCDLPEPVTGPGGEAAAGAATSFPLRQVRYALSPGADSESDAGLVRTETPVAMPASGSTVEEEAAEIPDETNDVWAVESATPIEEGVRITAAFPTAGTAALRIPELRYLRLRYWDGATWQDSWSETALPRGVEVTLALEALPENAAPEAVPDEIFRRVLAIPAGLTPRPRTVPDDGFGTGQEWMTSRAEP